MQLVNKPRLLLVFLCAATTILNVREADSEAAKPPVLELQSKIPLGDVKSRIDHMAIDLQRQRLFVAELGNNSVGVVDLKQGKLLQRIVGLAEPQGVGFVPATDTLYVANAGDGSVRAFKGPDYQAAGQIDLGSDADNIRVENSKNRIFVGYGRGALAVIDVNTGRKIADIPLGAHPEGFQLDTTTDQVFVNVPDRKSIAVIDAITGQQRTSWPLADAGGNFPMALDLSGPHVLVVFRSPAKLGVLSLNDGRLLQNLEVCKDADDVFVDAKRKRIYVSCGEGFVDIFGRQGNAFRRSARIPTVAGARTSLFVPELDLFLLAVRASSAEPAAIWVFRPAS
jgi:DNA-binding beta-propeller fold protein YncE